MKLRNNEEAQDELIKEQLAIQDAYGISDNDYGVFLIAVGSLLMMQSGSSKDDICEMIMEAV